MSSDLTGSGSTLATPAGILLEKSGYKQYDRI